MTRDDLALPWEADLLAEALKGQVGDRWPSEEVRSLWVKRESHLIITKHETLTLSTLSCAAVPYIKSHISRTDIGCAC